MTHSVKTSASRRFSEEAFRRFEPALLTVVARFPEPTLILPYPLAVESYLSRCRDALRAFVAADWPSELSRARCNEIFNCLAKGGPFILSSVVDNSGLDHVYFGPRASHEIVGTVRDTNISVAPQEGELDAEADPKAFAAFAYLKNKDYVTGILHFVNVSDSQLRLIKDEFPNVEIVQEGKVTKLI